MKKLPVMLLMAVLLFALTYCEQENMMEPEPMAKNPANAPRATIDRFSDNAGTLFLRSQNRELPAADEAIDFDQPPFITTGLGPEGRIIQYYNFDVQLTTPAPIYVLFREGESTSVENQLNIIDVIPGDEGYNDFWQVQRVTVPSDYIANSVTSKQDIDSAGYAMTETDMLVNCPVVPDGSTADLRGGDESPGLTMGWYKDYVVTYFTFEESPLSVTDQGEVPTSPIYVAFNVNPDEDGGGPASGFMTEMESDQTHNVTATLPMDMGYSPLWMVNVYDNSEFGNVMNLMSAQNATILGTGVALVNCPIVWVQ